MTNILEPEVTGEFLLGYEEVNNPEWFEPHAGLDERKGRSFRPGCHRLRDRRRRYGPFLDGSGYPGQQDHNRRGHPQDGQAYCIDQGVVIKTAFTGMLKYNELYGKFGDNLNKLLAWLHGRALKDALELRKPAWGLLDQFSKQPLVQKHAEGTGFDLQMRTKAEEDPVVAAASVIARATWLEQMKKLEELAGCSIPKGSGAQAKEVATRLFEVSGRNGWGSFANCTSRPPTRQWARLRPPRSLGTRIGVSKQVR